MNVHVLQHAPFENVGSIGGWLSLICALSVRFTGRHNPQQE